MKWLVITLAAPRFAASTAKAPVPVAPVAKGPVSFRLDVMPVFFRAGCNSGGCHGAAAGKDGFHLSLFGYDPAGDYYRVPHQIVGRRRHLAGPGPARRLPNGADRCDASGRPPLT